MFQQKGKLWRTNWLSFLMFVLLCRYVFALVFVAPGISELGLEGVGGSPGLVLLYFQRGLAFLVWCVGRQTLPASLVTGSEHRFK